VSALAGIERMALPETPYVLACEGDGYAPDRLLNECGYSDEALRADRRAVAALVVEECAKLCESNAARCARTADSKFVTLAGRMLHEGMYGGSKNCAAAIRARFGLAPERENGEN
jgi:hypothetical protein